MEFVAIIDQQGLAVGLIANQVIDHPQIEQLPGQRTFGSVLNGVPGRHERAGAAGGMPGDNHEPARALSKGFPKDQPDRRPDRAKGIGGETEMREDVLVPIEKKHEAVARQEGRLGLVETAEDISGTADA
jgi:hypothetical protein